MTELRERVRRLPKAPVEGWISLVGILVLTLTLAWSIDDAAWVLGRDHFTDFLALTVGWGIAIGFIGAKVGWGRWPTYLLGSLLAALIVPLYVGDVLQPEASLARPVRGDRNVARRGVAGPRPPQPVGHPGVRPLPADARAVHVGDRDVRGLHDVRPSAAAECDRARRDRARREHGLHVPEPAHAARAVQPRRALPAHPVPRLRRGVRVAAASHRRPVGRIGSCTCAVARCSSPSPSSGRSSSPTPHRRRRSPGRSEGWVTSSSCWAATSNASCRPAARTARWVSSSGAPPRSAANGSPVKSEAFSVQFEKPEDENLYWRAAVYDTFELTAWKRTVAAGYDVPATEAVLDASADRVAEAGRRAVTFRVFPTDYRASAIVSPQSPVALDTPVRVSYVGDAKFLATVDRSGGDPYTVTALVRTTGDDEDGALTINRLRAAGTAYPPRDPQAVPRRARGCHPGGRRRGAAPRRHPCRGRGPGQPVRRREHDGRLPAVVGQLQVRRRRPRPRLRGPVDRRVLRPLPRGLLPVLRDDDGDPAPPARHPDAPGCRVPAGQTRCAPLRARVGQRRACLGRGLLPRVRLGGVRPDGRWPCRCGAAADRRTGREQAAVELRTRRAAFPWRGRTRRG